MMRFQTAIACLLAPALLVPVLAQGSVASLADALSGTQRALEVLKDLERRLHDDPVATLGLILSATESPRGEPGERDRRLEDLRNEVGLLQMELDALQSPMLAGDGGVQGALGTHGPVAPAVRARGEAGITTGLDDSLRALLAEAPGAASPLRPEPSRPIPTTKEPKERASAPAVEELYSADPLRHGIACYRAGRYAEALALLEPLPDATALYWRARALERLERLDEAVALMERALEKGGEGFERRRAETDLEFLRWKRDFLKNLPAGKKAEVPR